MSFVESDLAEDMLQMFCLAHGDIPFTFRFVEEVAAKPGCAIFGECDFGQSPPAISIRNGLGKTDLIENLCHELAHLVCGLEADHNATWEQKRDELSARFWSRNINV